MTRPDLDMMNDLEKDIAEKHAATLDDNKKYDPLDSLEKEVSRFMDTNRFNGMQVTGFYIQSRCVINELKELRKENARLSKALTNMANMPEYDQDDAHRLRHQAKLALIPSA